MCKVCLTRPPWQEYKMLRISTHLGIRTVFPDDAEKTFYILPVSGSSNFSPFFSSSMGRTALSCLSSDLCFICKGVCKPPLLTWFIEPSFLNEIQLLPVPCISMTKQALQHMSSKTWKPNWVLSFARRQNSCKKVKWKYPLMSVKVQKHFER